MCLIGEEVNMIVNALRCTAGAEVRGQLYPQFYLHKALGRYTFTQLIRSLHVISVASKLRFQNRAATYLVKYLSRCFSRKFCSGSSLRGLGASGESSPGIRSVKENVVDNHFLKHFFFLLRRGAQIHNFLVPNESFLPRYVLW